MRLLDFLTGFESVQIVLIFGIGVVLFAAVIMGNIRKIGAEKDNRDFDVKRFEEQHAEEHHRRKAELLKLQDDIAEHEAKRRIDWEFAKSRPTLDGPKE